METISNFDLVRNKSKIKNKQKKPGFYCIPTEKLSDVRNSIVKLIEKLPYTAVREFEKACVNLISMKIGLRDIVQLKTRN